MKSLDDHQVLQGLRHLTEHLYWSSEAEFKFEVGGFNKLDRSVANKVLSVDEFLAPALKVGDDMGKLEIRNVRKYIALHSWIKQTLRAAKVYRYRTDDPSITDIYIVGISFAGNYLGLKTKAVET